MPGAPTSDVFFCSADVGLDHGPLVHRLRAALQRRDDGHVRGRPGLPAQGRRGGRSPRSAAASTIFYTAPTAIRACDEVGPSSTSTSTTSRQAEASSGRSASRSTRRPGLWYWTRSSVASAAPSWTRGGRRRRARIMVTTLPGIAQAAEARPRPALPLPGVRGRRSWTSEGNEVPDERARGCWRITQPSARPCSRTLYEGDSDRYRGHLLVEASTSAHVLRRGRRAQVDDGGLRAASSAAWTTSSTSRATASPRRRSRRRSARPPDASPRPRSSASADEDCRARRSPPS